MLRPSHFRTPRTIHEACFTDCRYIYRTPIERRIEGGMQVLTAVGLGLLGAMFFFFWLSA